VRIAPDKWAGAGRDFLLGDADHFDGIPARDLERLRAVLADADAAGLRVVLTLLSLPGARWRQHANGEDDGRLWQDETYRSQAIAFGSELAASLRDQRAVVGYDILNEPHPARALAGLDDPEAAEYERWWADAVDTSADLNAFYADVVAAIRSVDAATPIVLEAPAHAARAGMRYLRPVEDERVLYSFHFYEPWLYTTRRVNRDRYRYPERMPVGWHAGVEPWPRDRIAERMQVVADWAAEHDVPATRIFVGEFGVSRSVTGAAEYLADVIDAAEARTWHWAFYSWREDTWSEMDYEGGPPAVHDVLRSRLIGPR